MKTMQAEKLTTTAALLVLYAGCLPAAEVRGTVNVDYQGMFRRGDVSSTQPVAVALLPAAGQRAARRSPYGRTVEIIGNRMQPAFLTVQQGDSVEFINRDDVYHELFSLSSGKPVKMRLGKAGDHSDDRTSIELDQRGTIHFFCRIHNKSYARIDIVETPYIQMVEPGGKFAFTGLRPGHYRLRLAAPAAETAWFEVSAVTASPPLRLSLISHGGRSGRSSVAQGETVDLLYRSATKGSP
jgi:plastocyanin